MIVRSVVVIPECLTIDSVADDEFGGGEGVVGSAEQIIAGEILLPR